MAAKRPTIPSAAILGVGQHHLSFYSMGFEILGIPRFNDSPKNRLPWGDFGIRHGA